MQGFLNPFLVGSSYTWGTQMLMIAEWLRVFPKSGRESLQHSSFLCWNWALSPFLVLLSRHKACPLLETALQSQPELHKCSSLFLASLLAAVTQKSLYYKSLKQQPWCSPKYKSRVKVQEPNSALQSQHKFIPGVQVSSGTCDALSVVRDSSGGWGGRQEWYRIMGMTHPPHINLNWLFTVKKTELAQIKKFNCFFREGKKADIKTCCNWISEDQKNQNETINSSMCQSHSSQCFPQPWTVGTWSHPHATSPPECDVLSLNHSLHLVQAQGCGSEIYCYLSQASQPTNSSNSLWKHHPRSVKIQIWDAAHRD